MGARFEALADDLAAGWFSAAALPPPPPPVADLPANAGPNGRAAVGGAPALPPPPPPTELVELKVFGPQDVATSTTAPLTIADGECLGASLMLDGRAGFLRCRPLHGAAQAVVLDPCEPAPYDTSLVGCLPDPTGVPTLLRVDAAGIEDVGAATPPPPYRLLVLDGGDRCLPIPAPEPPPAPPSRMEAAGAAARVATVRRPRPPIRPGTVRVPRPRRPSRATSTTTSTTTTTTIAASSTTAPAPTPTVPIAERETYACAAGTVLIGLPDTSSPTWTATVRQNGLADRRLPVVRALS